MDMKSKHTHLTGENIFKWLEEGIKEFYKGYSYDETRSFINGFCWFLKNISSDRHAVAMFLKGLEYYDSMIKGGENHERS